mmetsp:Transcript_16295/g.27788  ORF Transcript_16295/g.27788 Transcript_16295/m.27788 type:complete len:84 (+) Transcript_16295:109-360(+)
MEKIVGYLRNSYPVKKLLNIYLVKLHTIEHFDERVSEMSWMIEFNDCVRELDDKRNNKKSISKEKQPPIKELIKELNSKMKKE